MEPDCHVSFSPISYRRKDIPELPNNACYAFQWKVQQGVIDSGTSGKIACWTLFQMLKRSNPATA